MQKLVQSVPTYSRECRRVRAGTQSFLFIEKLLLLYLVLSDQFINPGFAEIC